MKKPLILIVDPEPRQVSRIKELLGKIGADYAWAKNGGEGFRQALDLYPDLILSNTRLPRYSGVQMVQWMNLLELHIPVIYIAEQGEFIKLKGNLPHVRYSCWISRMTEELFAKVSEILKEVEEQGGSFLDVEYEMEASEFMGLLSRHDRKKILIAAEPGTIRSLYGQLESAGYYEVYTAHDGREALFKAVSLQPDLILCATHMPTLEGADLVRLLEVLEHPIPMVMLTLHQDPALQETLADFPDVKDYWIIGQCMTDRKFFHGNVQKIIHLSDGEKDKLDHVYREIDTMNLTGTGRIADDLLDDPTLFQEFDDLDLD